MPGLSNHPTVLSDLSLIYQRRIMSMPELSNACITFIITISVKNVSQTLVFQIHHVLPQRTQNGSISIMNSSMSSINLYKLFSVLKDVIKNYNYDKPGLSSKKLIINR